MIDALAAAIDLPLNVLAVPGFGPSELADLGVSRVSTGSLPYRAAMHAAVAAAIAVRDGSKFPEATPYPELQAALTGYQNGR